MTKEPTPEQTALAAALVELHAAEEKVRKATWMLPPLTAEVVATAETSWRSTPAQIVEGGYMRWTDVENLSQPDDNDGGPTVTVDPEWHANTDGWDDYSDEGSYEYVEVDGLPYAMPDDLDYD